MSKKSYILIFILVVAAGVIGFTIFGSDEKSATQSTTSTKSSEPKDQSKLIVKKEEQGGDTQSGIVYSNEALDSTGIRYSTYSGSKADVTTQISIGNGNIEPKTISAKEGQLVSITFTSGIRDEMRIEGYNTSTFIEPSRESTVQFEASKTGSFSMTLVNNKKTIGTLIVK